MNTYDFDKTVFYPDSSYCFIMFCIKNYRKAFLKTLPGILPAALGYVAKRLPAKQLKERLFSVLRYIPDTDEAVSRFWAEKRGNMQQWYLQQRRDDDIIISASPEFLLRPICAELGVRLIGTRMDSRTGRIDGENCHDAEKVRRFLEAYPQAHTECFYSDSLSDSPMADIADRAVLVKKSRLSPWPGK